MGEHILDVVGPEPTRVVRVADAPTGVVDVFDPTVGGDARPAVLLVHGGFWRNAYDRTHLRPLAAALAPSGCPVALPEYRRVGDPGGGWPGSLDDIVELLEVVPALLDRDLAETVIIGHSAGGHLAMLAAGRSSTNPAAVVSLAGVLDLAAARRDGLSDGAADAFLGDGDGDGDATAADPMLAPLPDCRIHLVHGLDDLEVPPRYSVDFTARDPRIRLSALEGTDHYDLIDPRSTAFAVLLEAIG